MTRAAARLKRIVAPAALAAALGACTVGSEGGSLSQQIGLTTPPPDEYAVVANRELQIPSTYALQPPSPGAPSLVEAQPGQEARAALFAPTESGASGASAGEAALLAAAGAQDVDPNIRQTVAVEQGEYVAENTRFGLTSIAGYKIPGPEDAEALDADEEARRLAGEGVLTPIAPDAPPEKKK
jgi:hypothetical protein